MKIERHLLRKKPTLEEFADEHGLTMVVHEFDRTDIRFIASFKGAEFKDGCCMLTGISGAGKTEADAIHSYADAIQRKTLVLNAGSPNRREITVPRFDPHITI